MGKLANYIHQRLCRHNWEFQEETISGGACFNKHIETYKCSRCGTVRQMVTIIPMEYAELINK